MSQATPQIPEVVETKLEGGSTPAAAPVAEPSADLSGGKRRRRRRMRGGEKLEGGARSRSRSRSRRSRRSRRMGGGETTTLQGGRMGMRGMRGMYGMYGGEVSPQLEAGRRRRRR
jgi:hypothetical protein